MENEPQRGHEKEPGQYRCWQTRSATERLEAVTEFSTIEYRKKHGGADPPPLDKAAVQFLPFPEALNDETR